MKIVCSVIMSSRHYNIKGWFLKEIMIFYVIIYIYTCIWETLNSKYQNSLLTHIEIYNNIIISMSEIFIKCIIRFVYNL